MNFLSYDVRMNAFAQSLRSWRQVRKYSQLDLALEADVSARHISFLETGRAQPSRDMITRLGEALNLPLAARNTMLTAAGFAARFPSRSWNHADMVPVQMALNHTMDRHAPYPAIALDVKWNIARMNDPAQMLYGMLGMAAGDSMLALLTSDALPQMVENWPEVAHHTALRLRTESTAQGGIAELDRTAATLAAVPRKAQTQLGAVVPMILRTPQFRLSLFATIAQFGTPEDVTLDALKIELFFPADPASKDVLEQLASSGD